MTTIPGQTQRSCTSTTAEAPLDALRRLEESHPFWQNELFQACRAGALRREDFQFLFGQYHLYSRNFTRYLSGLMANLEDDLLRSRLSENLWEEGGGAEPSRRHAQIFRNFLVQGLGLDLEERPPGPTPDLPSDPAPATDPTRPVRMGIARQQLDHAGPEVDAPVLQKPGGLGLGEGLEHDGETWRLSEGGLDHVVPSGT